MRKKPVFIFSALLILLVICVWTRVHTVPATPPVVQEGAEAPATVKATACDFGNSKRQ